LLAFATLSANVAHSAPPAEGAGQPVGAIGAKSSGGKISAVKIAAAGKKAAAKTAATKPVSESVSRLATFRKPSGEGFFALSVQAELPDTSAKGRDVVVLFDTSASQTATYRDDALVALGTLLERLQANDRVRLVAVDLTAVNLQTAFSPADGEAIAAAMEKLEARVPLGSTDMLGALRAAEAAFDTQSVNEKTVVYIGDGVSRARVLGSAAFGQAVNGLVGKRISVSSYAVGPEVNVPLLAAIANQTGGIVVSDPNGTNSAQQVGLRLAGAVRSTVAWPTAVDLPAPLESALPANLPPLRDDRDTVLVGALGDGELRSVTASLDVAGATKQIQWSLHAEESNEDFAFLPRLVDLARAYSWLRRSSWSRARLAGCR
jgi:hypothetical protein